MQEAILTIWGVQGSEQTGFGVKDNGPVSVSDTQLCEVLRVSKVMSYFIHCGCVVMVPAKGIIEIMRVQQMHNSPDALQAYATDETQSVGSSTGEMTPSFTILSKSALTLGHMGGNRALLGACWALSCNLMVYSPGNWPISWNLSGNILMSSSVDLIRTVFLGVAAAEVEQGRWEVSWMTFTVQFILTTSNLSHDGSPVWQDQGCLLRTNRSLSGMILYWRNQTGRWWAYEVIQRGVLGYHCRWWA